MLLSPALSDGDGCPVHPERLFLDWHEGREMLDHGLSIWAHTQSHCVLSGLNLSHSDLGRELGIDVESQRREPTNDEIVRKYFSATEQPGFLALHASLQQGALYLGWTRKEAYLKALGERLHAKLKDLDVPLHPEQPAMLRSKDAALWEVHSFLPHAGRCCHPRRRRIRLRASTLEMDTRRLTRTLAIAEAPPVHSRNVPLRGCANRKSRSYFRLNWSALTDLDGSSGRWPYD